MHRLYGTISRLILLPLFLVVFLFVTGSLEAQSSTETWMDTNSQPTISAGEVLDRSSFEKLAFTNRGISGNLTCEEKAINFSPADHLSTGMPMQGCWYSSSVGEIDSGGYMFKPSGWDVGGFVNSFNSRLFPTPNNSVFLEVAGGEDKSLSIRRSGRFVNDLDVKPADTGWDFPVFLEWSSPPSLTLRREDGAVWQVSDNMIYDQMWYSKNGNHLVIWGSSGYFVYVDLMTLSVKTVRVTENSESLHTALAVSDNGRYVAVNILDQPGFEVFDLWNCENTDPSIVSDPVGCASRLFQNSVSDLGLNSTTGAFVEFHNNDLISFYVDKEGEFFEVVFRAPNTSSPQNYIALGDSYSSGEGSYNYISGTDEPNNRCHISKDSYPFLLDRWLDLDSTHSVACSGARIHNITEVAGMDASQNKKYPSDLSLGKWLPGYKQQIEHIKDQTNDVDIVTIGVGGNDIGFSNKVTLCLLPTECFESVKDRYQIVLEINDQFDKLVSLYTRTRAEALKRSPASQVYVIGYPQVVKAYGSCGNNVRFSSTETEVAVGIINHLNSVVKKAATKAGVTYVSIEDAFYGHQLCESTSTPAVNGLTSGNGGIPLVDYPIASESYHPTAFGQELIASAIREETSNFSLPLPFPDSSVQPPDPLTSLLVKQSPDLTGEMRKLLYGDELLDNTIFKPEEQLVYAEGSYYQLKTDYKYEAYFSSEPTHIGDFESDENGNLTMRFTIPTSLEPGIHTLHIYGKNIHEESIDIYKTVFVAASEHDWDSDGVPNELELCSIFEPVNIDTDKDGIDDGCDNVIGPAPMSGENDNPIPSPSQDPEIKPNPFNDLGEVLSASHEYDSSNNPKTLIETGRGLVSPILGIGILVLTTGINISRRRITRG